MDRYKYTQLHFDILNQYIINAYNLTKIANNGKVYFETQKGMYSLPQHGRIEHDRLKKSPGESRISTC